MDGFLIPANTKKSMLKFGVFNNVDLIIFGIGLGVTLILLLLLPISDITVGMIAITPGLTAVFLVFPVPNYHNIRTIIGEIYRFYTMRRKFMWKGWCFLDGEETNK